MIMSVENFTSIKNSSMKLGKYFDMFVFVLCSKLISDCASSPKVYDIKQLRIQLLQPQRFLGNYYVF